MYKWVKKIIVFVVGIPLLALGIVLIPLPGPGLIITFLALLLLSTEVEQVQPFLERRRRELKKLWAEYKRRQKEIDDKYR